MYKFDPVSKDIALAVPSRLVLFSIGEILAGDDDGSLYCNIVLRQSYIGVTPSDIFASMVRLYGDEDQCCRTEMTNIVAPPGHLYEGQNLCVYSPYAGKYPVISGLLEGITNLSLKESTDPMNRSLLSVVLGQDNQDLFPFMSFNCEWVKEAIHGWWDVNLDCIWSFDHNLISEFGQRLQTTFQLAAKANPSNPVTPILASLGRKDAQEVAEDERYLKPMFLKEEKQLKPGSLILPFSRVRNNSKKSVESIALHKRANSKTGVVEIFTYLVPTAGAADLYAESAYSRNTGLVADEDFHLRVVSIAELNKTQTKLVKGMDGVYEDWTQDMLDFTNLHLGPNFGLKIVQSYKTHAVCVVCNTEV